MCTFRVRASNEGMERPFGVPACRMFCILSSAACFVAGSVLAHTVNGNFMYLALLPALVLLLATCVGLVCFTARLCVVGAVWILVTRQARRDVAVQGQEQV